MDNILIPFVTMISFIFSLQVKYLDLNLDGLHEPILVAAAPNALNSFLLLLKALRLALALALQDFFFFAADHVKRLHAATTSYLYK